jgi:hypothetical protein
MKNIFLTLLVILSFSVHGAITVVSDLDDTIKITVAGGNATDIIGDDVYSGIPEFLNDLKGYADKLYILSASPAFMRFKIESTLRKKGISYQGLILRSNLFEEKFNYKFKAIKRLMDNSSDDFIFIGDDLGKDPEVYAEVRRLYPDRVLSIYIHVVNGRKLSQDVIHYWTSFDLFLREFESFRMEAQSVDMIFDKLLNQENMNFIFPKKASCPTSSSVWEWQTRTFFMEEAAKLIEKFTSFCQARQSDNILL